MPLHYTKIFTLFALLTIGAFLLWLVVGAFWQGEEESETGLAPLVSIVQTA